MVKQEMLKKLTCVNFAVTKGSKHLFHTPPRDTKLKDLLFISSTLLKDAIIVYPKFVTENLYMMAIYLACSAGVLTETKQNR